MRLFNVCISMFLLFVFCISHAFAEDKPAVSNSNSNIAAVLGDLDGQFITQGRGFYAVPISHSLGFQLDTLGSITKGDLAGSIGGHLFWRNPDIGLLGFYAGFMDRGWPNVHDIGNVAFEGEYYLEDITISAMFGHEVGDREEFFLSTLASWYSDSENLNVYAGYSNQLGMDMAQFGFEYDYSQKNGQTIFLNSIIAECDETLVLLGVRFYFGKPKTLKSRHRQDGVNVSPQLGNHLNLDSCGMQAMATGGVPGL